MLSCSRIGAGSYGSVATERNAPPERRAPGRSQPLWIGSGGFARGGARGHFDQARAVLEAAVTRPIGRRRDPVAAAERLGELGRLAVADAVRDLSDGEAAAREHLGGAVHADRGQVLTERRVADLG